MNLYEFNHIANKYPFLSFALFGDTQVTDDLLRRYKPIEIKKLSERNATAVPRVSIATRSVGEFHFESAFQTVILIDKDGNIIRDAAKQKVSIYQRMIGVETKDVAEIKGDSLAAAIKKLGHSPKTIKYVILWHAMVTSHPDPDGSDPFSIEVTIYENDRVNEQDS